MEKIDAIIERVEEELEDALTYTWKSMHEKGKDTELSNTYAELARQELTHADMLCTQATRILNMNHEEYKDMQKIWDWHYKKFLHKKQHIRAMMTSS